MTQHDTVGHFKLLGELGRGTYGVVFRGADLHDPSYQVAVKLVHPVLASDPVFVDALRQERKILTQLHHPGIVQFRDLVIWQGGAALILEYLEGQDLQRRLAGGPMAVDAVISVLDQMLDALMHAHAQAVPVVHRDLKPSNVFLTEDGRVKLLDFGIARAADGTKASQTGQLGSGTWDYMAPEVWDGQRATPAVDVYAVGLVAWEMLTGRAACPEGSLPARMNWHLGGQVTDPRALREDVPAWLSELIRRLTARDLAERPANAGQALALLRSLSGASPVLERAPAPRVPPAPRPAPAPEGRRRSGLYLGLTFGGALCTLLACGGLIAMLVPPLIDAAAKVKEPGQDAATAGAEVAAEPEAPAGPVACSDEGATQPFLDAAAAWRECRFNSALLAYGSLDASVEPAGVQTCARERLALGTPVQAELQKIEQLVSTDLCHAATGALAGIGAFSAPQECLDKLSACEAKEHESLKVEVARSQASLNADLVDGDIIKGVSFRPVPGDPWQWDIVVKGEWKDYFELLQHAANHADGQALAAMQIIVFTNLCGTVGEMSQKTRWRSRRLVFEDGGSCHSSMKTSEAREVSRRLKKAVQQGDTDAWASAMGWTFDQIDPC